MALNLHMFEGKYDEIIAEISANDPDFVTALENAINAKDAKSVINLSIEKAKLKQVDNNFSDGETIELAFEIFVTIFEPIEMPTEQKQKMALGLLKKMRETMQSSQTAASLTELPPPPKTPQRISPPSKAAAPAKPASVKPVTPSFKLHMNEEKYRDLIMEILSDDPDFGINLRNAITNKDSKGVINISIGKAKGKQTDNNFSDKEMIELAYELFVTIFEPMDLPAEQKQKMASGLLKRMQETLLSVPSLKRHHHFLKFLREPAPPQKPTAPLKPSPVKSTVPSLNLHVNESKYSQMVTESLEKDPEFAIEIQNAISSKDAVSVLKLSLDRAKVKQDQLEFSDNEMVELAYELFIAVFERMDIPSDQKQKMSSSILNRMQESVQGSTSTIPESAVRSTPEKISAKPTARPSKATAKGNKPVASVTDEAKQLQEEWNRKDQAERAAKEAEAKKKKELELQKKQATEQETG